MRRRNADRMTIVEQLVNIREQVCIYSCIYKRQVEEAYDDEELRKAVLQGYCHDCPLTKLHYDEMQ